MFESLGLDITPRAASIWLGLGLGLAFGALAQITRFCLRRALIGPEADRRAARGVWAMALAVAMLGTQGAVALGWIGFDTHRFHGTNLPVIGLVFGGLLFGAGTVLARGCLSRLTILSASGNLRALVVVLIAAIIAHATLQGALAPVRTTINSVTLQVGTLPGTPLALAVLCAAAALFIAVTSQTRPGLLLAAAALGALVPLGWIGTGFVLFDEFDPITHESLAFTSAWSESLFWGIASGVSAPRFGVGLIGGVLAGAALMALLRGEFRWQGYETPGQMGRGLTGGVLMGLGGVLAGGCTLGAGLSGLPTLGLAAIIAFAAIVSGILLTDTVARRRVAGALIPAE